MRTVNIPLEEYLELKSIKDKYLMKEDEKQGKIIIKTRWVTIRKTLNKKQS